MSRRADVQGIRALAIVMVVAFHAGLPVDGGFAGVDVFFVISGFVIGTLLLGELERTGRLAFGPFLSARVRRLLPALAAMIVVTVVAAALLTTGSRLTSTIHAAIGAILMVANLVFYREQGDYFAPLAGEQPLLHTWTLSVEGQLYLVIPFLLAGVWWAASRSARRPRPWLAGAVIAAAIVSFALAELLSAGRPAGVNDPGALAFYASPTRAWEFLVGILVALAAPRLRRSGRQRLGAVSAAAGLAAVVAAAFFADDLGPAPGRGALLPVAGAALLLVGGTIAPGGPVSRTLGRRPLTAVGDGSYSWYLWHWPVIVLGAVAIPEHDLALPLAAASVLPAWLSYRLLERPIRENRAIAGRRAAALGAVCVAGVAVTAGVAVAGERTLMRGAGVGNVDAALTQRWLIESGACVDSDGQPWTHTSRGAGSCLPDAPPNAARMLLIGDSQADAASPALQAIARRRGLRFDAIVRNSCLAVPLRGDGEFFWGQAPGCERSVDDVAQELERDPPALLVVGQSLAYSRGIATFDDDTAPQRRLAERRYRDALDHLADPVLDRGGRILFLLPVPEMPRDATTCASALKVLLGRVEPCLRAPASAARDARRANPIAVATIRAGRGAGRAVFDPTPLLCDARWCNQIRGGRLAYRDRAHLSVDGALDLTDELDATIARLTR